MENDPSLSNVGCLEGKEYIYLWREWKINSWVETSLFSDFAWLCKSFGCFYFHFFTWCAWFMYFLCCLVFFFVASSTLPVCFFPLYFLTFFSMKFITYQIYICVSVCAHTWFQSACWESIVDSIVLIVAWNKILTGDNLRLRGFDFVDWCIMCRRCGETVDHLLLHYEKAHRLWSFVFKSLWISWLLPRIVPDLLFGWWNWLGKHLSNIWNLVSLCLLWCLEGA